MRKILVFFLLLISLTVIASCNTAGNNDLENLPTTDVEASADNDEDSYRYIIVCSNDLQKLGVHRIISEYIENSCGENIETVEETANYAGGGV